MKGAGTEKPRKEKNMAGGQASGRAGKLAASWTPREANPSALPRSEHRTPDKPVDRSSKPCVCGCLFAFVFVFVFVFLFVFVVVCLCVCVFFG
jgi:hypothetical protein